jgi:hypothetical protein
MKRGRSFWRRLKRIKKKLKYAWDKLDSGRSYNFKNKNIESREKL